jgi:FolB domain-containing protein
MTDQIVVRDLLLRAIIGINPDERVNRQDVLINITMWADTRAAGLSDEIADAVNYRTITKDVIEHVESSACFLVERLAQEVADVCLRDHRVESVEVTIEKPMALRFARSVGVTIRRDRTGNGQANS